MRNRELLWLMAVLSLVALAGARWMRPTPPARVVAPFNLSGHWLNRSGQCRLELGQWGSRVEGRLEGNGGLASIAAEMPERSGQGTGTITRMADNTTVCKVTLLKTDAGLVLLTSIHDCCWDGEYVAAVSNFSGRWVRPDGIAVEFRQMGDSLEGSCDSPSYSHRLHLRFQSSSRALGTMERTHKGSHLTTICQMHLIPEGDGFRMGIDRTDGKTDLPSGYHEEYRYTRVGVQ